MTTRRLQLDIVRHRRSQHERLSAYRHACAQGDLQNTLTFYWLHRLMHKEPFYRWSHKVHHKSTAPNLVTTFSENPVETFINGSFFPVLMVLSTLVMGGLHVATLALIVPFNLFMGLYVHSGHEFLPSWWNKSWATKWFITTTFHDQHHKYFNYNYGGYSPVWDYICGTVRKNYERDFERAADRRSSAIQEQPASEPISA